MAVPEGAAAEVFPAPVSAIKGRQNPASPKPKPFAEPSMDAKTDAR